jgi:general secretion pathway protein L
LQLSILELKGEFNANIDSVAFTGGTSQIQNLGPFLTQILEVPANKLSVLDNIPNLLFERTPQMGSKLGVAIGLAFEGFKKPRNPPLNFMRGEFAKQNHQLRKFFDKWTPTLKVAAAAMVVLFVYTSLRETFSLSLAERSQETLQTQAKTVAGLKGKAASESGIRKYIRDNKKRAADLKTLASVSNMNSALDIVKKVSDATPAKNSINMDIQSFRVEDSLVTIQGYLNSTTEVSLVQKSLANITTDGQVRAGRSSLSARPGRTAFSFSFNVDRGIQKVTK